MSGTSDKVTPTKPTISTQGTANGFDPRSPALNDVPRTPSAARKTATNISSPSKSATKSPTIPEPTSPLADFITQTDASGTPTHRPKQSSNTTLPSIAQTELRQTESTNGSMDTATKRGGQGGGGEVDVGGVTGMLCCCFQPNGKGEEGQGKTGSGGNEAKNADKKKSKKPVFNTFHYDDPAHPANKPILPPVAAKDKGKMCLVLDLDETLVHSSFRAVPNPDYIIPVQIEDVVHHVYVCKRPGVDEYLRRCGERYEVVIYTASLNKYADPLLNKLDKHGVIRHRLFRESCTQYQGNYVKNLNLLGRDLRTCIIVDNSPLSYLFHPENAVGCISWIDQQDDDELRVIQDFCEVIENEEDIRYHMRHWRQGKDYDVRSAFN